MEMNEVPSEKSTRHAETNRAMIQVTVSISVGLYGEDNVLLHFLDRIKLAPRHTAVENVNMAVLNRMPGTGVIVDGVLFRRFRPLSALYHAPIALHILGNTPSRDESPLYSPHHGRAASSPRGSSGIQRYSSS